MAKKKKKPYYPNNWKAFKDAPSNFFYPIPFDEFMDWKIGGYEIPSSIACIIREHNLKTGKVSEYVYQRPWAAKNKCIEIMDIGESEFIVCDENQIHHMTPKIIDNYEDNYDPFS
tara:strand:+ start:55 stop:399 length:345 start_codon:yes stop_codon:yes gene_type:complete